MGVMRKSASMLTLGLINFRSKRERRVLTEEKTANAAMLQARANAKLADAQREALKNDYTTPSAQV